MRVSSMTVYRLIKSGNCAPSGSARRTGSSRTTSTPTWPAGTPRPADTPARPRPPALMASVCDRQTDSGPTPTAAPDGVGLRPTDRLMGGPALRHDLLPLRLRHHRRVRRRGEVGHPLDRARSVTVIDITHDIPPYDVRAGAPGAGPERPVPLPRRRAGRGRPRRRHRPPGGRRRGRRRRSRSSSGPTTGCWPRRSAWSAAPPRPWSSPTPSTGCGARADLRRARRLRPGRRPPVRRRARSRRSGPASIPATLRPRPPAAAAATRTAPSWPRCCGSTASATPAQRRSRRDRDWGDRVQLRWTRPTEGTRTARRVPSLRRAAAAGRSAWSSTPTGCWRWRVTGASAAEELGLARRRRARPRAARRRATAGEASGGNGAGVGISSPSGSNARRSEDHETRHHHRPRRPAGRSSSAPR